MGTLRRAADRGHTQLDWLDSRHTFSFGGYHDPAHMGFRALRVLNEDRVAPGRGFPTHRHHDMEIVTWVLEGALEHRDSLGTGSIIRPGDVQRMSAGTGITHSEFDHSATAPVHFLQMWITPERMGLPPSYEERHFTGRERAGVLRLVASRDGRQGSVTVHQDVALYATLLTPGDEVGHALAPGRHAWVQVARGALEVNSVRCAPGDGVAVSDVPALRLRAAADDAEALVFDLA